MQLIKNFDIKSLFSSKLSLKNSFIISVIFHILIIIIFSVFKPADPFKDLREPIVVDLESVAESMSDGISDNLEEAQHSQAPVHNEQLKKDVSTPIVPEKTMPVKKQVKINDEKRLSENLKKDSKTDIKNQLNQEKSETGPKIDTQQMEVNKLDKQMEDFLNQEEANRIQDEELTKMEDDISKILDEDANQNNNSKIPEADSLKGGEWSAAPRKTLYFPDIASKIPEEYKKKGQNYSIKMRITFDKNGLAIRAQVITSSGDPRIDSVFKTELRKVKVESITRDRVDEVVKVFTISTK